MIFFDEGDKLFFLVGRKFDEKDLLFFFHQFVVSDIVGLHVIDPIDAGSDSGFDESLDQIFEFSSIIWEGGHCD
jgi:hypothetical protein